jgi:hypothetical protein
LIVVRHNVEPPGKCITQVNAPLGCAVRLIGHHEFDRRAYLVSQEIGTVVSCI